jgi:hypothetical protein
MSNNTPVNGGQPLPPVLTNFNGSNQLVKLDSSGALPAVSGANLINVDGNVDSQTFNQITTPANPDANKNKLYFKADGNLYKLNSTGVESAIAGGSSVGSLDDLTDVGITSPANSQVLLFVNGKWENRAITDCGDLFGSGGKIPITKIDISTINIRGTWNANTNITYPKAGGTGAGLTDGTGADGDVWIVQTAGNTTLGGYTGWAVNDWAYRNGTSWVKLANGSTVLSVNGKTGAVALIPNDLLLGSGSAISGTINAGDGIETAILKIKNFINNASTNKPPLTYFVNAGDIQISGAGTSATISWNAQSNAVRYRVFAKQTSLGAINIITDTPVATVNAPTNFANVTVSQGIGYTYAVLADKTTDTTTDIVNFTTASSIPNFTLDTFDLSAGTTATLAWGSVVGAVEYRIQYQRATSLSNPTIISSITGTSRTITGLTASNPDDATTPYSFKVLAYNSSSQVIAETAVITRPVFARISLKYFYDSATNITVSSIARSSDLATCNTTANHNLKQGDVFSITNSVAPFNVSYALVFDVPSLTSFRYVVANSGATSTSTATLQKFENPFITWNYYKFSQYLSSLETATKKILPRNPIAYTLSATPLDYTAELIFPTAKYQNSGDSMAGWYLIKYHNSDDAIAVLADATNKNVAMQMFDGTFSYSDRQDKFLFPVDDHRSYKLWHGGFAYLQNNGSSSSETAIFYRLDTDLTEKSSAVAIANRPSELSNVAQAMPVRLSLSGYTVYFDNNNQRLIIQKKDGTRKIILTYSALGMSNIWGFSANVGGGTLDISSFWYAVTNNLDTIIIANRGNGSIGSYRLIFNFTAGTVNITTVNRIIDSNLSTEENCFGDQIDTYFNLRTNTVQAVRYLGGGPPTLTLRLYGTPLTDLSVNTTDLTMTVPGAISQPGIGPVSIILTDGSIYWIDWGHDDRGMYRLTGNDDGLGIIKMVNMSVHPRLLSII